VPSLGKEVELVPEVAGIVPVPPKTNPVELGSVLPLMSPLETIRLNPCTVPTVGARIPLVVATIVLSKHITALLTVVIPLLIVGSPQDTVAAGARCPENFHAPPTFPAAINSPPKPVESLTKENEV